MILFDTETTGLVGPDALPIDKQPRIIEFSAVKLDDKTLKEKAELTFLVHPGIAISPEITRITGLTDADLKGKPTFGHHWAELVEFFLGQRLLVAHNLAFDASMLALDLRRIGREHQFPWPPQRLCTVEASYHIKNRRLKLGELYELATGHELKGAHRAINDVRGMAVALRWLVAKKKLTL